MLRLNDKALRKKCFQNSLHIARLIELNRLTNKQVVSKPINYDDNAEEVKTKINSDKVISSKHFSINELSKLKTLNKYEYMYKIMNVDSKLT